jgi:hypothetical protein
MNLLLKDLSTNPYTQYKVHMWGAMFGEPQPPPIPLEPPQ